MTERRFNEAEVAAIFQRAAESTDGGPPQTTAADGMTLAELQEIGREVGIPAESMRQWTNGNLQALLEPTATGHRLRLRTVKRDAAGMLGGGIGMFVFAAVMFVIAALRGALDDRGFLLAVGVLAIFGAVMFASSALRLPRWARTRGRQMEEIAARITAATTAE
jgi:hypothetical protein